MHLVCSAPPDHRRCDAVAVWHMVPRAGDWALQCSNAVGSLLHGLLWLQVGWGVHVPVLANIFTYHAHSRDIYIDSHDNPTIVTIHLSHSKTDPFKAGVSIHLGWSGCAVCPVAAILGYIVQHGLHGPLFLFGDRSPLSRQKLMGRVKQALTQHSIDSTGFTGHTFRIGAATSIPLAGLKDSFIHWVTGTHPLSCSIFGPHFRCCIISTSNLTYTFS